MSTSCLGLGGVVLSFAGGVFLTYDSLRARRKILAHFGARKIAEDQAKREGKPTLYETPDGKPLDTELDWELWLAEQPLKWTWIGFALISVGFLLDIFSRILSPGS